MRPYVVSLSLGLLVGIIYALFHVRSPAPPIIALVGLLGILVGEQLPPLVTHFWLKLKEASATSWIGRQVAPHMFGQLPRGTALIAAAAPEVAVGQDDRIAHRGQSAEARPP